MQSGVSNGTGRGDWKRSGIQTRHNCYSSSKRGREFAAWVGLDSFHVNTPPTGGKQKLLGISKRGNRYLRKLFVQVHAQFCSSATSSAPV